MKKLFLLLLCSFTLYVSAQVPQAMNYQAIARNASGTLITGQLISLRFTIHDQTASGNTLYQETDTATTNQYGLFTAAIGNGVPVTGTFASINWGSGNKFLQVEIDTSGGSNYVNMGTTQLLSVPYAQLAGAVTNNIGFFAQGDTFIDLSDGDSAIIPFDIVTTNDGNGFANNTFTAPVAGFYQLNAHVEVGSQLTNGYLVFYVEKNGQDLFYQAVLVNGVSFDFSSALPLAANDAITIKVICNSTSIQIEDGYAADTYFSGYRIY